MEDGGDRSALRATNRHDPQSQKRQGSSTSLFRLGMISIGMRPALLAAGRSISAGSANSEFLLRCVFVCFVPSWHRDEQAVE